MKIISANNYYYLRGGSERVMFEEASMLSAAGHTVIPFSMHFKKNFASEYSEHFAPAIEYEDVSFFHKVGAAPKLIYSFKSKANMGRLLDMHRPDLMHAHNIYGRLTTSILDAADKRNVPIVMTLHDYKVICPSYSMLLDGRPCERCLHGSFINCLKTRCHKNSLSASLVYTCEAYLSSRRYDYISAFLCPSRFLLQKHAEAGIPDEKLVHLPNFLDAASFEPCFDSEGYVLYAGRLSKEKGLFTLLRAARGLEAKLHIVGEGPENERAKAFASERGLSNVVFKGYLSGEELAREFRGAASIVFPSEWYENAPMTILEAFAYGKPVIGSNIGGIPEMVIEGETGLLFKTGDYQKLREKIVYLLSNPAKIQEMGKKAREKVEKEYNADVHYSKLMEIYQGALS